MFESFTLTFTGWGAVAVVCAIIIAVWHTVRLLLLSLVSGRGVGA